jgi:hypothetical protein
VGFFINNFMEQNKKPVDKFFYSDREWDRLGCGPLPEERKRENFQDAHAKGNPKIDNNIVKGYN